VGLDRLKAVFTAIVRGAVPRLEYYKPYIARVVQQQSDGSLDIEPEDPKVPPMGSVPLRHGIPGVSVTVQAGSTVVLWFSEGDPARSFCGLWGGSEGNVVSVTLKGATVNIGDSVGADQTLMATAYRAAEDTLFDAIQSAVSSINSGVGATLGTAVSAFKIAAAQAVTKRARVA
jgi:hypothetical protein